MSNKEPVPPKMVYIRHQDDESDEYAEVTEDSFNDYYAEKGWVIVDDEEVRELAGVEEPLAVQEEDPSEVEFVEIPTEAPDEEE